MPCRVATHKGQRLQRGKPAPSGILQQPSPGAGRSGTVPSGILTLTFPSRLCALVLGLRVSSPGGTVQDESMNREAVLSAHCDSDPRV